MFGGSLGDVLLLAVGVALSPIPIIACILVLFSPRARVNGPAYLLGCAIGMAATTTGAYLLSDASGTADGPAGGPTAGDALLLLLGVGCIGLGVRQWRSRPRAGETPVEPAWMRTIESATPVRALGLGIVLTALNPKNVLLAVAGGIAIERAVVAGGSAVVLLALFVAISCSTIAVAVGYLLVGGDGARKTLEGWRAWMTAHSSAVMTVLFIAIGAKLVGSGLDGFL
jgi:hypothetical protein